MTWKDDWLDGLLDRHPGAPVPEDFGERVRARLRAEEAPVLAGPWRRRLSLAAAGLMLLAGGYWLGRGAPEPSAPVLVDEQPAVESAGGPREELDDLVLEIYENRDLLESFSTLTDAGLEILFREQDFDPERELLAEVED